MNFLRSSAHRPLWTICVCWSVCVCLCVQSKLHSHFKNWAVDPTVSVSCLLMTAVQCFHGNLSRNPSAPSVHTCDSLPDNNKNTDVTAYLANMLNILWNPSLLMSIQRLNFGINPKIMNRITTAFQSVDKNYFDNQFVFLVIFPPKKSHISGFSISNMRIFSFFSVFISF